MQPRRLYQNTHESNPIISSHLNFPEKQRGNGPHTGTFKAPASRKGRDLDEAIRNVEGQLRAMEGELLQKVTSCVYTITNCDRNLNWSGFVRKSWLAGAQW